MASAVLKLETLEDRKDDRLGYAGNISAQEAWSLLESDPNACLIDVRTMPEWVFVGVPDLAAISKKSIGISWKVFPTMQVNPNFGSELQTAVPSKDSPLCFICKTGGRSLDAAIEATRMGYSHAFNIEHGFEGDKDSQEHRGLTNGWKATGLPWEQQ